MNKLPKTAPQTRCILRTPERLFGRSLEEQNKNKLIRVLSQMHDQPVSTQTQDTRLVQTQRQSVIINQEPDRRFAITNENVPVQTRPAKPPNYSRINSTIKLVRPVFQSSSQLVSTRPGVSYSTIVKGNTNTKAPNTTGKSTLKSTNDLTNPSTSEVGVTVIN